MKRFFAPLLIALSLSGMAQAPKDDVVFRALSDELARSTEKLHLDEYAKPYFVSDTVTQTERLAALASFGGLASFKHDRTRTLKVDLREGDYALDSSSASSMFSRMGGAGGGESITIEDDYDAIRHAVWLRTDSAYKKAIEELASKKAFLQDNEVKERPDSMSKEKPVVDIEPIAHLECDEQKSKELVRKLSAIFREYPGVKKSLVGLDESATTRWFVNSEGFRNRTPHNSCAILVVASAQADDGSIISDADVIAGERQADLPPYSELEKRVRSLGDRITHLATAKTIEQYRGPVLFEKDAAAEFFGEVLQPNLGHAPEGLDKANQMLGKMMNPLAEKIGTRVLPTFITVVDDPLAKTFGKSKIISNYAIDDDGMRAQKITLIDKGILKTFAMSRAPSHEIKQSNGHAVGRAGVASNIFIESEKKVTPAELKAELISMGKENGLKEVLLVKRLSNYTTALLEPSSMLSSLASAMRMGETKILPPVLLYKVSVDDGHEELVRATEFGNVTMRVLRDIETTGNDPQAYPVLNLNTLSAQGMQANTIVTPSILVREIELQKSAKQNELPPTLKNPYFDKQ